MAEGAPALPEAVMTAIRTRATSQYNEWKTSATAEQKAGGIERMNKMKNEPEFRAEMMGKMTQMWNEADANQDGKLDLAEYKNWQASMDALAVERGDWRESGDHSEENYNLCNQIGEGDGITQAEMFSIMGPWMKIFEELKAADGL